MFNPFQFIADLFTHTSSPLPAPEQSVVDEAGAVLDGIEIGLTTLQNLTPNMPAPYKGLVAGLAISFHNVDSFVDQYETPASSPVGPTSAGAGTPIPVAGAPIPVTSQTPAPAAATVTPAS